MPIRRHLSGGLTIYQSTGLHQLQVQRRTAASGSSPAPGGPSAGSHWTGQNLDEIQEINIPTGATGSIAVSWGGQTTAPLSLSTLTASSLQTAFTGLTSVGSGNAIVTGYSNNGQGPPFRIEFYTPPNAAGLGKSPQPLIQIDNSLVTGTTTQLGAAFNATAAGAFTDETAAANSATANDMTLMQAVPAVNDAYYFGFSSQVNSFQLNVGTAGTGTYTIIWEYWNGTAWKPLPGLVDGTNGYTVSGIKTVSWTVPRDWSLSQQALTISSRPALYYIRARVSSFTSQTVQAKGTQAFPPTVTVTRIQAGATAGSTLLPLVGGQDDQMPSVVQLVAEAPSIGNICNPATSMMGTGIRTGAVIVPPDPSGSAFDPIIVKAWGNVPRKHYYAARIPGFNNV